MAVYTKIDHLTLEKLLSKFNLGNLVSFEGILKGVSNTNYHVFTDRGRYVLTIFEEHRTRREDLPYLFAYAGHLASHGIPCPQALLDHKGDAVKEIQGKAGVFINFLEGQDIPRDQVELDHCRQMGAFTARMHKAVDDFTMERFSDFGQSVWAEKLINLDAALLENYQAGLGGALLQEISFLQENWPSDLPAGAIHADLFPDNIFFHEGQISAMIDMYFACNDLFLYDLAIVVNAWCFDNDWTLDEAKFKALIEGYQSVRPLSDAAKAAFQTVCRGACVRFLISRLEEFIYFDPEKTQMKPHDPKEYLVKLAYHQAHDVSQLLS